MMKRFAGGVTVVGILGFIIMEALKILLVSLAGLAALGVGIFFYRRRSTWV